MRHDYQPRPLRILRRPGCGLDRTGGHRGYAVSANTLAVVILIAGGAAIFIKEPGLRKLTAGTKIVQPETLATQSLDS